VSYVRCHRDFIVPKNLKAAGGLATRYSGLRVLPPLGTLTIRARCNCAEPGANVQSSAANSKCWCDVESDLVGSMRVNPVEA